jgi:hypothetical protein
MQNYEDTHPNNFLDKRNTPELHDLPNIKSNNQLSNGTLFNFDLRVYLTPNLTSRIDHESQQPFTSKSVFFVT